MSATTTTVSYLTTGDLKNLHSRVQFAVKGSSPTVITQWIIVDGSKDVILGMRWKDEFCVVRISKRDFMTLMVTHSVAPLPLDPENSDLNFTPCRDQAIMKTEMGWKD